MLQQYEGGFGRVYIVSGPDETKYALKTLKWELSLKKSELAQEALRLIQIPPHPHIIQVKEIVWKDETPYLLMSYYPSNLRSDLKPNTRLDTSLIQKIVFQVSSALDHLHNKAMLLHLDLKPENILKSIDGSYSISDFGISQFFPPPNANGVHSQLFVSGIVGTIAYLSPEQIVSRSVSDKSDVFALGIILYELLTGNHPFVASSPDATVRNILSKDIRFAFRDRFSMPKNLIQICLACLRKNPEHRPSASQIATSLGPSNAPLDVPAMKNLELEATINKANTLTGLGDFEKARSLLESCLASNPWFLTARINLAFVLNVQRKFEEAIQIAEDTIRIYEWTKDHRKSFCTLLVNLSNYYLGVDPQMSVKYSRKAVEIDSSDWQALGNLAEALRALGEYRGDQPLLHEGKQAAQKALKINSLDVKLRTTYGGILLALGNHETLNPILVALMNEVGEHDISVRFLFIRTCIKTGQLDAAAHCLNPMRTVSYLKEYITQLDQDIARRQIEIQNAQR